GEKVTMSTNHNGIAHTASFAQRTKVDLRPKKDLAIASTLLYSRPNSRKFRREFRTASTPPQTDVPSLNRHPPGGLGMPLSRPTSHTVENQELTVLRASRAPSTRWRLVSASAAKVWNGGCR